MNYERLEKRIREAVRNIEEICQSAVAAHKEGAEPTDLEAKTRLQVRGIITRDELAGHILAARLIDHQAWVDRTAKKRGHYEFDLEPWRDEYGETDASP